MTSTFTTDFRHEFEQEQERWLRKRFLWYAGVVIGLGVISGLFGAAMIVYGSREPGVIRSTQEATLQIFAGVISTFMYLGAFAYVYAHLLDRARLLRLVFVLIVASGLFSLVSTPIIFELSRDEITRMVQRAKDTKGQVVARSGGFQIGIEPDWNNVEPEEPAPDAEPTSGEERAETPAEIETDADAAAHPFPEAEHPGDATTPAKPFDPREVDKTIARMVVAGNALGSIFLTHLFACLFLPWTPRESLRPMVPLLVANAVITLLYIKHVPMGGMIAIATSPLTALPGAAICWWRQRGFKEKFTVKMLKGRYGEMKQELGYARQIHESMFPDPLLDGPIRVDYHYEPMRQIGGDYLFVKRASLPGLAQPVLNMVMIDVTGHGIGAALTVNRLYGEIERQYGEKPRTSPGELLTGLNAYLHHSLATHSVYATALCVQVDPNSGTIAWASAGHPPAFLRTVDGKLDRLDSTTLVLGACHGDDFQHGERLFRFGPGDTLIAYTDGAIEARNADGKMLRVEGLERMIAGGIPDEEGGWSSAIVRNVDSYRKGPPEDDTLVVEVWRPVR